MAAFRAAALLLSALTALIAVEGCTDETGAPGEDGAGGTAGVGGEPLEPSCLQFGAAAPLGLLPAGPLTEASGLAASRRNPGVLWLLEDSGNEPALYAIDRTAKLLLTLTLTGVVNVDFEALAIAPCDSGDCLFVGEIGDNGENRTDVAILRLPEPLLPESGPGRTEDRAVTPERFDFRYPDGAHDAEALVVTPAGEPVVLTKRLDGSTLLYGLGPLTAGTTATARLLGSLDVTDGPVGLFAAVTAADLAPDGRLLLVRTYGSGFAFRLGERGVEAPRDSVREPLPVAAEPQGEALAYDPVTRGFWQVGEGTRAPLYFGACTR